MKNKNILILPGLFFSLSLLLLVSIDYIARVIFEKADQLVISEPYWFAIQILISIITLLLFLRYSKLLNRKKKLFYSCGLVLICLISYVGIIYSYIFETGIDGF